MPVIETRYEQIVLEDGVPRVAGTTMKIVELVAAQRAYGWSAEELHFQYPHLALGKISAALAYYWDHMAELDADLARRLATVDALRAGQRGPAIAARLRARRDA